MNINWRLILESLKSPARQVLIALYAFLVNQAFTWLAKTIGFEFTEDQKAQILSYGTPVVWALLSWIDRVSHLIGKRMEAASAIVGESILTRGLTRF